MDGKFISYIRVSTDRQGRSGLGLEAQRQAVADYLNGGKWDLVAEFVEVESGRGANALDKRPQLRAAIDAAKRAKATLVIAKLDRLARNVHFISGLLESGVDFVAVDNPTASRLTVQILAAVAEDEARRIRERTRDALAAAKARGTVLGKHGREVLSRDNRAAALDRARKLYPVVAMLRDETGSVRRLVERLNSTGVKTPNGKRWHIASVHRLLRRMDQIDGAA